MGTGGVHARQSRVVKEVWDRDLPCGPVVFPFVEFYPRKGGPWAIFAGAKAPQNAQATQLKTPTAATQIGGRGRDVLERKGRSVPAIIGAREGACRRLVARTVSLPLGRVKQLPPLPLGLWPLPCGKTHFIPKAKALIHKEAVQIAGPSKFLGENGS